MPTVDMWAKNTFDQSNVIPTHFVQLFGIHFHCTGGQEVLEDDADMILAQTNEP